MLCPPYRKKRRLEERETRPPVVIILEGFEAFPPHILQDLIMSIRYVGTYKCTCASYVYKHDAVHYTYVIVYKIPYISLVPQENKQTTHYILISLIVSVSVFIGATPVVGHDPVSPQPVGEVPPVMS